jgi:D-serine deaminase-like pyridoxal phosphate-dependent protein
MPAGVRVQQLTPVVRASSTQPTTIVRLMSPATTTVRPGTTGQQQIIQLNTNKQQQHPLVIKAITAQTSNRQQQPILLAANTQQKTITSQTQQQVLVLNQNTLTGQQPKFTLQMTNVDQSTNIDNGQQESTKDNPIPQLDGTVDDQVNIFYQKKNNSILLFFISLAITKRYIW